MKQRVEEEEDELTEPQGSHVIHNIEQTGDWEFSFYGAILWLWSEIKHLQESEETLLWTVIFRRDVM